jgi:ABC-2 type transport system ATP-binding protein
VHQPSVLLLDEPESGLDPGALLLLEDYLIESRMQGRAIIATSHSFEFALRTGSRIAILDRGRFVFEAINDGIPLNSLKEIFTLSQNPKHETVS